MTYAYSENYVLVLSHDEVVHLKCSMINKMPGYLDEKFENLKAGYGYMAGHPGKKLLSWGRNSASCRSGVRPENWTECALLQEEKHQKLQDFVRDMLHLYKKYPALYGGDGDPEAFQWINANDGDQEHFQLCAVFSHRQKSSALCMQLYAAETEGLPGSESPDASSIS